MSSATYAPTRYFSYVRAAHCCSRRVCKNHFSSSFVHLAQAAPLQTVRWENVNKFYDFNLFSQRDVCALFCHIKEHSPLKAHARAKKT